MTYQCTAECVSPEGSAVLCHCRGCHKTFATIGSFDLHRYDPDVPEDQNNTCWEPESVGLDKDHKGVYGTPDELETRRIVAEKLAKARAAK